MIRLPPVNAVPPLEEHPASPNIIAVQTPTDTKRLIAFIALISFLPFFQKEKLEGFLPADAAESLETIITSVESAKEADFKISFDPTLVRGMSYYTGTIFEISMDEFGGSVGGGGRYDEMIGKFTGQNTPAVGFSIGFERIVMLLLERGYQVPTGKQKKAYLLDKNLPQEKMLAVLEQAKADRADGMQVMIVNMKKNKKFQKEQLAQQGYTEIEEIFSR